MSSKEKHKWAIPERFSPWTHDDDGRRHILKKPEINPFVVKSVLNTFCQRFRKSATRENFNKIPDPETKENYVQLRKQLSSQWKRRWREEYPISSFMSARHFSTSSKTCMHLKIRLFSRLPTLPTFFRHKQGNRRASALNGSEITIRI